MVLVDTAFDQQVLPSSLTERVEAVMFPFECLHVSISRGVGRNFERGSHQFVRVVVVCSVAMHGQLAGHRGWVREGNVPPPAKGGSF